MKSRKEANQGMNWIRQEKRLAIYLRDGLACMYCGDSVENGAILSLDHIKPYSKGGSNSESNLICACKKCNSSRGNRSLKVFCESVAGYLNHGVDADAMIKAISRNRRKKLSPFLAEAKELIARRGSAYQVLNGN
jgi:hypothetical protein